MLHTKLRFYDVLRFLCYFHFSFSGFIPGLHQTLGVLHNDLLGQSHRTLLRRGTGSHGGEGKERFADVPTLQCG